MQFVRLAPKHLGTRPSHILHIPSGEVSSCQLSKGAAHIYLFPCLYRRWRIISQPKPGKKSLGALPTWLPRKIVLSTPASPFHTPGRSAGLGQHCSVYIIIRPSQIRGGIFFFSWLQFCLALPKLEDRARHLQGIASSYSRRQATAHSMRRFPSWQQYDLSCYWRSVLS